MERRVLVGVSLLQYVHVSKESPDLPGSRWLSGPSQGRSVKGGEGED